MSAASQFHGARLANASSKQPNPPTPPEGLRWGEGGSGSTRKRIDSSPDVKGVFGEGASVVAVAPAPPPAADAEAVANLFRADAPFSPSSTQQDVLVNTRAKSRGLWNDPGQVANEGSAPLSPSRVGALPRAVVGRAVTEAPPHAVALAAPLPSRPAQRTSSDILEIPANPASSATTQRSLPAVRPSLPGGRPSLPQTARSETPAMRLDLAFKASHDLSSFSQASRAPSNQNAGEEAQEARASSLAAQSFQDEPTTVKDANPAAAFAVEEPIDVAVEDAPKPSLKAPAPRTTPPAAQTTQKPRSLQPRAAKPNSLRLPLLLVCAGALAAAAGFVLAGGKAALWNPQPTAAKLAPVTVQPTVLQPPAPTPTEAKPQAAQPSAPDTTPQEAREADKVAAAAEAAPQPVELPSDTTPEQQLALARSQLRAKHPEAAEALLRLMIAREPDDHHVAEALAAALLAQGKGAAALPYAEQIVHKRPKRAPYRVLLGDVKLATGDRAGAIAAFQDALRIEPTNRDAKRRLAALQ